MSSKDQFNGKLAKELLQRGRIDVALFEQSDQGGKRAAQGSQWRCEIMDVASPDAMMLLGGIHKVEIDGKGAYHVDGGIQVAAHDDVMNGLV